MEVEVSKVNLGNIYKHKLSFSINLTGLTGLRNLTFRLK